MLNFQLNTNLGRTSPCISADRWEEYSSFPHNSGAESNKSKTWDCHTQVRTRPRERGDRSQRDRQSAQRGTAEVSRAFTHAVLMRTLGRCDRCPFYGRGNWGQGTCSRPAATQGKLGSDPDHLPPRCLLPPLWNQAWCPGDPSPCGRTLS